MNIKHIKSGFGKSSKLDNHPSTFDDVLKSSSENILDTTAIPEKLNTIEHLSTKIEKQ